MFCDDVHITCGSVMSTDVDYRKDLTMSAWLCCDMSVLNVINKNVSDGKSKTYIMNKVEN